MFTKAIKPIDSFLNGITMYRLLLYGLSAILISALVFAAWGFISLPVVGLALSIAILLIVCYGLNRLLAVIFHAYPNSESALITALILACILPAATSINRALLIALTGGLAMASKYLLAWRRKHVFNPAAASALIVSTSGLLPVTWWIATPILLPVVSLVGLLVIRKVRLGWFFALFASTSLLVIALAAWLRGDPLGATLIIAVMSWPLVFFGTIMVTEPLTMPGRRYERNLFAILVGSIFASQLHIGPLDTSPQLALIIGNIFAFSVNPLDHLAVVFRQRVALTPTSFDYIFDLPKHRRLHFLPGQYMEWTLPHHRIDGRGNRRTFTIASAPEESSLHLGVKFYEPSSSYKQALAALQPGDTLAVGNVAGEFLLPAKPGQSLVWIAGGIGITPFRSMLQHLLEHHQSRPITLFYLVSSGQEIAYKDVLDQAKAQLQTRIIYVVDKGAAPSHELGWVGQLDIDKLIHHLPAHQTLKNSLFYLSGPPGMVQHFKGSLRQAGVNSRRLTTDFFPGY